MKPTIQKTIGGYRLEWSDDKVVIEVSRIRETKVYTTCEIIVSTDGGHLMQTSFSLTNVENRKSLQKQLEKQYQVDWHSILEQLCVYVLNEIRRGEPVYQLGDETVTRPKWTLEPFVLENQPSVIFGSPSSGKSTLGLILVTLLGTGVTSNNGHMMLPGVMRRVLILDWETDRGVVEFQLQTIRKGMGLEVPFPIFYRRCSVPLADDLEQISAKIAEYKADTLLIDSLGLASGGDLNSPESALRFFSALRALNCTPLILAHTARGGEQSDKHIFGSMYFEATARNIWEVVKTEGDADSIILGLYHRKPPPFAKLYDPMGYRIGFDKDATYFEWYDPKSVADLIKRMSATTQILEALKKGKMNTKQLSEETGISENSIRMPLKRLRDKKLIIKMGDDYALPAREDLSF